MYYETNDIREVLVFSLSRPYSRVLSLVSDSEWEDIVRIVSSEALGFNVDIEERHISFYPGCGICRSDSKDISSVNGFCSNDICVYIGSECNEEILEITRSLYRDHEV